MEHVLPERAISGHPHAKAMLIGPPAGVSREDCGDAHVLVSDEHAGDGMGHTFWSYFRPTEQELARLNAGGFVELTIRGGALVPHAVAIY